MTNLSEKEIRPPELMADQRVAALTDIGRLLSRCAEFVTVACPACGSSDNVLRFEKNGIRYVDCRACPTFYVNPRPPSAVLDWFYRDSPNYAYWNKVVFPASEAVRRQKIFAPRVDRVLDLCRRHSVPTHALLEVGAGFGTFCDEMKVRKTFARIVAVEPTPDLAMTIRKRGIDVIEKPIESIELAPSDLFDVVASFEVIEHLFSPKDFIGHMRNQLRPGGLLILTCPNGRGFDVEALGALSNTVDHEHLNYFSPASLSALLRSCGLEVLESFTPGKLDADLVRNKILSKEFEVSKQPFLKRVLLDEWEQLGQPFQQFLVSQGLSSNMWLVARKVAESTQGP